MKFHEDLIWVCFCSSLILESLTSLSIDWVSPFVMETHVLDVWHLCVNVKSLIYFSPYFLFLEFLLWCFMCWIGPLMFLSCFFYPLENF